MHLLGEVTKYIETQKKLSYGAAAGNLPFAVKALEEIYQKYNKG